MVRVSRHHNVDKNRAHIMALQLWRHHTNLRRIAAASLIAALCLAATSHLPAADGSYVSSIPKTGAFTLAANGKAPALCVSTQDYPGVIRVARLLQRDIRRVSDAEPSLVTDGIPAAREIVLIGTLGRSPLIDRLVQERKLDVREIAGKWETFIVQTVEKPVAGVDRALVIAGSDKRGTLYGMFDVSAKIGVSPWNWWADVPPERHAELHVLLGRHVDGPPRVKYRGIFINDEAPALAGWAREKFGGLNARFYDHVFELILRLKGNYLWPAMWGEAFYDDDPASPKLADEYGIVIGTSHHEPMMRAHDEWRRYGSGPWNYDQNEARLKAFWREGITRMGSYESVVTLGMRGDGDEPMSEGANIALLEKIVRDQRQILGEVTGKKPVSIPQVWALYKEVQEYYDRGMRVPDDVTLLLCDDNWGNIRKLPALGDKPRAGGYGIYYHFDFVGGPRNYKWLNTIQIARVWEQMRLAYEYGARQIWIVNVGDIKPMELPIQFFLDYAWNPEGWSADRVAEYARGWAQQQFGAKQAEQIGRILTAYTTYNSRRKPELLSPETYSLHNYREAERVVSEYAALADEARRIATALPADQQDAYYQLVLHPVEACATLNDLYVTVARNRLFARQGRASTNNLAARASELFRKDSALSHYYNTTLAGGKWNHMMDQTHISYTTWQQPEKDVLPDVETVRLNTVADMGVAIEGSDTWWPHDTAAAVLPGFDPYGRQSHFIEVFARGTLPVQYTINAQEPYVRLSSSGGSTGTDERVSVDIDWVKAPKGTHRVPLTISGPGNMRVVIFAVINNPVSPEPETLSGFVESNGVVSVEADHFTKAVRTADVRWERIADLGRTGAAMTPVPVTAASVVPGEGTPCLEYAMHLFTAGEVTVHAYLSPTLNFRTEHDRTQKGLCYGISFDAEPPQIINMHARDTIPDWLYPREWNTAVSNNVKIVSSRHKLVTPGRHVLKFWMVDPGVVLQKLVIDAGGLVPSYLGPPESARAPLEYSNPVLAGFYPDPSICRVGGDYYLVTSTFAYFPGLPVFHSRDLVNWELIGHVMDRPGQLNLDKQGVSRGLFAPSIRHHEGVFYVVCTLVDIGGNFVVTSPSPRGPWSDPVWIPEINGIDPSMFFDDDGKAYIIYNSIPPGDKPLYDGHRTIRMYAFDTRSMKVTGKEQILVNGGTDITQKPVWIEAPHIFRHDGSYYLIAAEGGTGDQHSEVVFRSAAVGGPYVPFPGNPILTQRHLAPDRKAPITSTGHADFVQTEQGDWWAVFLGCRPYPPYEKGYYNTGRETFLAPVKWRDGWPVITTGDEEVQYYYPYPLPRSTTSGVPYSGNFTVRDEFSAQSLDPNWVFLRTPQEKWYDLEARKGALGLRLRPETCSGNRNPSFLGRRLQHLRGSASTALHFTPGAENEKAGILIFQNETHFYYLCKSMRRGKAVVQLFVSDPRNKTGMIALATREIGTQDASRPLRLKIEANGSACSFLYGTGENAWTMLNGGVDATVLSTRSAGGFVGCMVALYTTSLGKASTGTAFYDWFEYTGNDEVYETERR